MIFMIYRNATYYDPNDSTDFPGKWFGGGWGAFNGAATLGNIPFEYVTNGGYIVSSGNGWISALGSGITYRNAGPSGKWKTMGLMTHEYGHYLFGDDHTNYSGIMGGGTYALNGWERIKLDYIVPDFATTNNYISYLGDFVETGDILKISVPYNNPGSSTYFLVENHQRTSSYDHIVRGGPMQGIYNFDGLGKGVFVYLVTNGYSFYVVNFELMAADGYFDWQYVDDFWAGPGFYTGRPWEGWVPITEQVAVNRDGGKNDRMPRHIYWNSHWASKWVDKNPLTNEYELNRDVLGDLTDAYNFEYNVTITRWTNPSTDIAGTGHNISVQLYDYNPTNGEFTIKASNSFLHALLLPPAKPQLLQVERSPNNHPLLTWEENLEQDISKYYVYKNTASAWYFLDETTNNYYEDESEILCADPPAQCENEEDIYYRVTAIDNQQQESLPSEFILAVVAGDPPSKRGLQGTQQSIEYALEQNYPNPFNPNTVIAYSIKKDEPVILKVFDILGNEVAVLVNEKQQEGFYKVNFNAEALPSGIYFYTLTSGNFMDTKKLILLK